jgi:prepilin-type N-terminal cleavage/methylation domain-containing protein
MKSLSPTRGFTLIELLVVIGLIALLASGVGIALNNKNPGTMLQSAQGTLVGALSSARSQAALNQADAMIIVKAGDPSVENFLRSIQIVVEKTPGSDDWREVGTEIILPEGVYVVPGATITNVMTDPAGKPSTFFSGNASVRIDGTYTTDTYMCSGKFTSLGLLSGGLSGSILVAPGTFTSETNLTLENKNAARGLVISRYGIATSVDDVSGL